MKNIVSYGPSNARVTFSFKYIFMGEETLLVEYMKGKNCRGENQSSKAKWSSLSANIYLFKVNYRNITKRCEICLKLTIKAPEQRQ